MKSAIPGVGTDLLLLRAPALQKRRLGPRSMSKKKRAFPFFNSLLDQLVKTSLPYAPLLACIPARHQDIVS
jgi:hypothetical protein